MEHRLQQQNHSSGTSEESEDNRKSILRRTNSVGDNKKEVRFAEQLEKSIEIENATRRKPKRSLSQPLVYRRPVETVKDLVKSFVGNRDKTNDRSLGNADRSLGGVYKNLLFSEVDSDEGGANTVKQAGSTSTPKYGSLPRSFRTTEEHAATSEKHQERHKIRRTRSLQERQRIAGNSGISGSIVPQAPFRRRVFSDSDVLSDGKTAQPPSMKTQQPTEVTFSTPSSSPVAAVLSSTASLMPQIEINLVEPSSQQFPNYFKKCSKRSSSDPGPSSQSEPPTQLPFRIGSLTTVNPVSTSPTVAELKLQQLQLSLLPKTKVRKRPPKLGQLYTTLSPVTSVSTEDESTEEAFKQKASFKVTTDLHRPSISTGAQISSNNIPKTLTAKIPTAPVEIKITSSTPTSSETRSPLPEFKNMPKMNDCSEVLTEVLQKLKILSQQEAEIDTSSPTEESKSAALMFKADEGMLIKAEEVLMQEVQTEPGLNTLNAGTVHQIGNNTAKYSEGKLDHVDIVQERWSITTAEEVQRSQFITPIHIMALKPNEGCSEKERLDVFQRKTEPRYKQVICGSSFVSHAFRSLQKSPTLQSDSLDLTSSGESASEATFSSLVSAPMDASRMRGETEGFLVVSPPLSFDTSESFKQIDRFEDGTASTSADVEGAETNGAVGDGSFPTLDTSEDLRMDPEDECA